MTEEVTSKVMQLLSAITEREGLTLYDLEFVKRGGGTILCVYIDKKGGVDHGDCRTVSNQLSAQLEVEEAIAGPYTLEVSSPGLTRKLKKEEHFVKSGGLLAKVTFIKEFDGPQQIIGRLELLAGKGFRIVPEPPKEPVEFMFKDVARARLELE